jgi:hypothetical protein
MRGRRPSWIEMAEEEDFQSEFFGPWTSDQPGQLLPDGITVCFTRTFLAGSICFGGLQNGRAGANSGRGNAEVL